jgi:multiple sugar transport system substrate-binding protein
VQSPIEEIPEQARARSISRRRFLLLAGSTSSLVLLAACGGGAPAAQQPAAPTGAAQPAAQARPGGFSGGGSLKILVRTNFVPAFDEWLDRWAADWGSKNKVEVTIDHVFPGDVPAKIAAEVAAGSGHDLYGFTQTGSVNLYSKQLVDVSDVAKQVGQQYGGWITPLGEQLGMVEGVWKGLPDYFYDFPTLYRKDLFDANGLKPVETWEDLLKTGAVLKEKGYPIGICINQKANDGNNSWNSLLWCYGASYVGQDGKTVTLNSPETREAVRFAVELYNKTMTDEVLSWDDSGNNQFLASGRGSWIQNPISALRSIEASNKELAAKIAVGSALGGPKGRLAQVSGGVYGLMSWSQNASAAKAFLTDYYGVYLDGVKASTGFNQPLLKDLRKKPMPILGDDPRLVALQDFDQIARASGYPGPPTLAAAEVESNWLMPLMIGHAVQDGNVDEAVKWADEKVQAIYAKYK